MKQLSALLCLLVCLLCIAPGMAEPDYVAQLPLNRYSETAKTEATVKTFVDGDTTHFYVPETVCESGVLRARYLALNTPEITGKVEEYGQRAAAFTRKKLESAESIILESDTETWNLDSTGDRHLVWVWYRPAGAFDYRCLNLEILQNGLARANSTGSNRYGSLCTGALRWAQEKKLNLHSGQRDPDFYYGEAMELTLRELRSSLQSYRGKKVAFRGIVTMNGGQSVYVEDTDAETGFTFGMPVYYGYGMSGAGLDILSVGNEVRIVGTLQYYEAGGTWQVSGLTYRMMKPNDPGNIQKLSDGHSPAYTPVDAQTFASGSFTLETAEGPRTFPWAELALGSTVRMDALKEESIEVSPDGAMTLLCTSGGASVAVRTEPLYENGVLITPARYENQTLSICGLVDFFDGAWQIRVLSPDQITIE